MRGLLDVLVGVLDGELDPAFGDPGSVDPVVVPAVAVIAGEPVVTGVLVGSAGAPLCGVSVDDGCSVAGVLVGAGPFTAGVVVGAGPFAIGVLVGAGPLGGVVAVGCGPRPGLDVAVGWGVLVGCEPPSVGVSVGVGLLPVSGVFVA